jgi:hypothetical protein
MRSYPDEHIASLPGHAVHAAPTALNVGQVLSRNPDRWLRQPVGQISDLDSVGINRREVVNERVTQERSSEPS